MKNILITGGAGFIGSNIAQKLLSMGYFVRVLDNLSQQIHGEDPEKSHLYKSIKNKVDFILGDVRDENDWISALDSMDAVIHLAAETGTGQSMYEIKKYTDVNITGTAILLDYLTNQKHSIKKVIIASSRAVYGEGKYFCAEHGNIYPLSRNDLHMGKGDFTVKCPFCKNNVTLLATDEDSKLHPTSVYGITKQMQEELVLTSCKSLNIPAIAFRYQNVYGPGQSLTNPYTGILSIFSTCFLNNIDINIFEDGKESRDFVYIDDVVNATICGLEADIVKNNRINVGTGVSIDVLSVANLLKDTYHSKSNIIVSGNYRVGDIRHNFADIQLLKNEFN
jgi:dTDP-L-rhamnose 4-epimerase